MIRFFSMSAKRTTDKSVEKKNASRAQLAELIKSAMRQQGLSARAVATRINVDRSHFWRVLQGQKTLSRENLEALADVMGIPRRAVLHAAGEMPSEVGALDVGDVTPRRSSESADLHVITDPQFIDSALFYWLFSTQPFEPIGIRCRLSSQPWHAVAQEVAVRKQAIGFANRREAARVGDQLVTWADLCLYTGYALLARRELVASPPATALDAATQLKRLGSHDRVVICIGADTVRQFKNNPLLRKTLARFRFEEYPNAEKALRDFLDGTGDFFSGGLPQRLAIANNPISCTEVLTFENSPLLFAVNSLVCSASMAVSNRSLVTAVMALWFETISRIKSDARFRAFVVRDMLKVVARDLGSQPAIATLGEAAIGDILLNDRYEIFPENPGQLFTAFRRIFQGTGAALQQLRDDTDAAPEDVLAYVEATLGSITNNESRHD